MKCLECPNMICRVFIVRSESWTGFCSSSRCAVTGDDLCHRAREPTTQPEQLELSFI